MRSTYNTMFIIEECGIQGICEQGMFIKTSISREKLQLQISVQRPF